MIAPPNFGYVEDGIYRCGSPDSRSFGFLASLKLRTTILLTDSHDEAFIRFLQECGVNVLYPLSLAPSTSGVPSWARPEQQQPPQRPPPPPPRQMQNRKSLVDGQDSAAAGMGRDGAGEGHGEANALAGTHANVAAESGDTARDGTEPPFSSLFSGGGAASPNAPSFPGLVEDPHSNVARFLRRHHHGAVGGGGKAGYLSSLSAVAGPGGDGLPFDDGRAAAQRGGAMGGIGQLFNFTAVSANGTSGNAVPSACLSGGSGGMGGNGVGPGGAGVGHRGLMTLSESVVVDILHVLLDPRYYPVLITCPMGRYRTGIVCGCLRKLQRWNLVSILEEYRRFAGEKSRAENEDFIELFDKDLVSLELQGGQRPTILYS